MLRRSACLAGLAATLLLGGQAAAAPAASPPWQAAQRMQDSVFDAQSALLLDEPRSAVGLVRRAERQLQRTARSRTAPRRAPPLPLRQARARRRRALGAGA